jgi:thymidylate synthase
MSGYLFTSYVDALATILNSGSLRVDPKGNFREIIKIDFDIGSLKDLCTRRLSASGCLDEANWIMSGSSDSSKAGKAATFWKDFPTDLGDIYGAHIGKQFHKPKDNSRRDYFETGYDGAMIPCVNSLQLFKRDDAVYGLVSQRSADMICGFPHDVLTWQHIANTLAEQPVILMWQIGSAHIYEDHIPLARKIIRSSYPQPGWDFCNPITSAAGQGFQEKAEMIFQGTDYHDNLS